MDVLALNKISYGLFVLTAWEGEKINGCIVNTVMQVTVSPNAVAVAINKDNLTCEMVKNTKEFTVSVLSEKATFDIFKRFGLQSGRDVDKFKDIVCPKDDRGVPYLQWGACAMFSCKIVDTVELGSHTLFIGEVLDAKVLSDEQPITYADYQKDIKPKPEKKNEDRKVVAWKCKICGYIYEGSELPKEFLCPLCGHGPEDFEPIYE